MRRYKVRASYIDVTGAYEEIVRTAIVEAESAQDAVDKVMFEDGAIQALEVLKIETAWKCFRRR